VCDQCVYDRFKDRYDGASVAGVAPKGAPLCLPLALYTYGTNAVIPRFTEPRHLLEKMLREARNLLSETDELLVADHLFNFCVTCHTLRDWVLKHRQITDDKAKRAENVVWDSNASLKMAKDIANSSKHFGITRYQPTVSGVSPGTQNELRIYLDQDASKVIDAYQAGEDWAGNQVGSKPSYTVELDDGTKKTLAEIATESIGYWLSYFDAQGISRDSAMNAGQVFFAPNIDLSGV
jgi:hypothetical protein